MILSYWTDDVKSAACCRLLNWWRQNDRWPRNLGMRLHLFGEQKNKELIFWFKSLKNSADLGLWPWWITPSLICRILHILRKPNSIIVFVIGFVESKFRFMAYWCRYRLSFPLLIIYVIKLTYINKTESEFSRTSSVSNLF